MRDTPDGIVEELRDAALEDAVELGLDFKEMVVWQAADLIEHLIAQLRRIAGGEAEPVQIAAEAVDPKLWTLSEGR